ncbi:MAG: STAS domain-containing protein [Phycisphaerales bacterium]|nr:STAS domain-containing protein [Phycisphaerales bacterium]
MTDLIESVSRNENHTVVRLNGEIDLHRSPELHHALVDLCNEKPRRLIVNLSKVQYIDSSGIGSLVDVFRRLKRGGGALFLVSPSERVTSVLEITRLNEFFTIVADEQQALSA